MKNKPLKVRLVLRATIDPRGESVTDIQHRFEQVVRDAVSNGTLTGDSPATLKRHDYYVEIVKPKKPKRNKSFMVVNDNDANDSFNVDAKDYTGAAHAALLELGWWIAKN